MARVVILGAGHLRAYGPRPVRAGRSAAPAGCATPAGSSLMIGKVARASRETGHYRGVAMGVSSVRATARSTATDLGRAAGRADILAIMSTAEEWDVPLADSPSRLMAVEDMLPVRERRRAPE